MKLFYIRAENEDENNLDLLVWANDPVEAKKHWQYYFYDLTEEGEPQYIGEVPTQPERGPINRIIIIPPGQV